MSDQMTTGRRLVLNLAQREEANLAKQRRAQMKQARCFARLLAVEEAQQLRSFRFRQRLEPSWKLRRICRDELFHDPQKVSYLNRPKRDPAKYDYAEDQAAFIAGIMMWRGITSRDLAARMEGDPLRNLMLLRLLFAGGAIMGSAIEARINAALGTPTP